MSAGCAVCSLGVTARPRLLVASLAGASTAAAFNGVQAKVWAGRIAAARAAAGRRGTRAPGGRDRPPALTTLGYNVTTQRFPLPEGGRSLNVVGRTPGPIRVIIVAHMDGVPGTNAANDNGSGVGVMLMLAQYLADEHGVLVAASAPRSAGYTGAGWHLGSRRLTRSLTYAQRQGVRLAVSIDMVGVGATLNIRGLESSPEPLGTPLACRCPPARDRCELPAGHRASPTTTTSRAVVSLPPGSNGAGIPCWHTALRPDPQAEVRTGSAPPAESSATPRSTSSTSRPNPCRRYPVWGTTRLSRCR